MLNLRNYFDIALLGLFLLEIIFLFTNVYWFLILMLPTASLGFIKLIKE